MDELAFLPATEQARLVREREVSPVELVESYLERIERLDPELGAYVTVRGEEALADARAKAEEAAEAPFHGVPIALKDLDTTAGIRTTFSCKAFAANVPGFDLAHVERTHAAGFVVLGKTNTPEFGTTAFTDSALNGPCRTPWDLGRNAGGSSGGAAAAVAAGLVGIAQGSDGGGWIRIPASCCGLFGLKASRGRVSNAPFVPGIGLGTSGPLARTTLPTPPRISTSSRATSGAIRSRPLRRSGPSWRRSASTPGGCGSRRPPRRRSTPRSIQLASRPRAKPPSCSPRSATRSSRQRRTGAVRS